MQSLPTTTANTSSSSNSRPTSVAPPTTTYTTIPISGNDVISRSLQNTFSFFSLCRPWPEFFDIGVFDRPESFSLATDRLRKNASYFRLNYAFIVFACVLLSLLGTPFYLVLVAAIFALWMILYVFREDELILMGYHISDRMVLVGLVCLSVVTLFVSGILGNLMFGVGVGMVVSAVHGGLRNPDGLFLNEDEAASSGLINAGSRPVSRLKNVVDH